MQSVNAIWQKTWLWIYFFVHHHNNQLSSCVNYFCHWYPLPFSYEKRHSIHRQTCWRDFLFHNKSKSKQGIQFKMKYMVWYLQTSTNKMIKVACFGYVEANKACFSLKVRHMLFIYSFTRIEEEKARKKLQKYTAKQYLLNNRTSCFAK